jgi:tetratricopeptide (TPR) repeat protein
MEHNHAHHRSKRGLDNFLYGGLLALVAALPLFILPIPGIAPPAGKVLLIQIAAIALFLVWLWKQFRARTLTLTRSALSYTLLALPLLVFVASLLSQDFGLSFFGEGFSTSSGLSWVSLGLLGFLAAQIFTSYKRVVALYAALVIPFLVVALFQVLRFVLGPNVLQFGVLNSDIATLVGNWNDLGIYAGFVLLVSLVGLEFLKLKSTYRRLLFVVMAASVVMLFLTNVSLAWLAVTVGTFLVFLYKAAFRKESEMDHDRRWRLPIISLSVFLLTLVGAVFLGGITQQLFSQVRPIQYNEVRVAPGPTLGTALDGWQTNPATGVGPNFFGYLWQLERSEVVSRQPLSDVQFGYGFSVFLTMAATLGVLGLLLFAFIIVRLLVSGVQVMTTAHASRLQRFFALSMFVLTLYLWLLMVLYVPGPVMLAFTFILLGAFAGLAADARDADPIQIGLRGEKYFAISVVAGLLLVAGLGGAAYRMSQQITGLFAFRSAVFAETTQEGYEAGLRAARIGGASQYYRSLASLLGQQAAILASQADIEDDEQRSQLEFFLGQALTFSLEGTQQNPYDYRNWVTLGDTYAVLESYDVEGSYLNARNAYERALERNPRGNDILARLANLELSRGNNEEARAYVTSMLERRPNDAQALAIAAQLEYDEDNDELGDAYVEAAANAVANEPQSLMQLGVFAFNQERFLLAERIFLFTTNRYLGFQEPAIGLLYALEAQNKDEEAEQTATQLIEAGILTEEQLNSLDLDTEVSLPAASAPASIAGEAEAELVEPAPDAAAEPVSLQGETESPEE